MARLLGDHKPTPLFSQELTITRELADSLAEPGTRLYFDWGPDYGRYLPHVDKRPPLPAPADFIGVLALARVRVPSLPRPGHMLESYADYIAIDGRLRSPITT